MSKKLFEDFNPVSTKAWKQKIQLDLKGADYNKALIWNSLDGIDVKPFYNDDDINDDFYSINTSESWKICQTIQVTNSKEANTKAIDVLNRGAESLHFIISNENINSLELLKDIDLKNIPIIFELEFISSSFVLTLNEIAQKENAVFHLQMFFWQYIHRIFLPCPSGLKSSIHPEDFRACLRPFCWP